MKRAYTAEFSGIPANDIRKDIAPEQLAAMGAIALAYNYSENTVRRMLLPAVRMPIELHRDVVTRINGVDGIIEIIKLGAKSLGLSDEVRTFLADSLGGDGFKLYKKYREAVIHARILNKDLGIGELVESKGAHSEVLLTNEALNACYDRLDRLRLELSELLAIMLAAHDLIEIGPDDPERAQLEAKIQDHFFQAQSHRSQRLSLPPIPEFPSAKEMTEQENLVPRDTSAAIRGWFQPPADDAYWVPINQRNNALYNQTPPWPPTPQEPSKEE